MTVNDAVQIVMAAISVWCMTKIWIGLVQPPQPQAKKRRGSWTQDEASGKGQKGA